MSNSSQNKVSQAWGSGRTYSSASSSSSSSGSGSGSGFGPFLDQIQNESDWGTGEGAETRVVEALSDGSAKEIAQIMNDSRCLPLEDLLDALDLLTRYGLLDCEGDPGKSQRYRLSDSGIRLSRTMGSWTGKSE